jgi:hypothetical protein
MILYDLKPNKQLFKSNPSLYNELLTKYRIKNQTIIYNYPIAAAITSYSRIIMDPYKRIPNNQCYNATHPDSVF